MTSVGSNSSWLHGLQPTRLLCPQYFFRQEYWSGLPFPPPRDLPNPGIKLTSLMSPLLAGSLPLAPPGKPLHPPQLPKFTLERSLYQKESNYQIYTLLPKKLSVTGHLFFKHLLCLPTNGLPPLCTLTPASSLSSGCYRSFNYPTVFWDSISLLGPICT